MVQEGVVRVCVLANDSGDGLCYQGETVLLLFDH